MRALAVFGFVATAVGAVLEIALTGLLMPGVAFVAIPLAFAGLVWARSDRVSLAIAAVVAAVFLYGNLAYPVTGERLRNPAELVPFVDALLRTLGLAGALVGSVVLLVRGR